MIDVDVIELIDDEVDEQIIGADEIDETDL